MSKKKIQFTVYVTIEVDTENDIVKEYATDSALVEEVVSYEFSKVLPVMASGAIEIDEMYHDDIKAL